MLFGELTERKLFSILKQKSCTKPNESIFTKPRFFAKVLSESRYFHSIDPFEVSEQIFLQECCIFDYALLTSLQIFLL